MYVASAAPDLAGKIARGASQPRAAVPLTHRSTPSAWSLDRDRKSTRLNSSHSQISYAVFCLKKKKHKWLLTPITHALMLNVAFHYLYLLSVLLELSWKERIAYLRVENRWAKVLQCTCVSQR